jgi:hypothetical protein
LTLLDLDELLLPYLAEHPPTHILVAAFVGWKPKEKRSATIDDLARELGPGFQQRDVHDGLGAPVLDFARLKAAQTPAFAGAGKRSA